MPDFAKSLDVNVAEIERPPLPPTGHYTWRVTKYVFGDIASDKGEWDTITFNTQAIEAGEDVDLDDLAKAGGIGNVRNRVQFMIPKGDDEEAEGGRKTSLYRMRRFLAEHCGLGEEGTLREKIDQSINAQFLGQLRHRQDKNDPETFYAEIGRTAPVE